MKYFYFLIEFGLLLVFSTIFIFVFELLGGRSWDRSSISLYFLISGILVGRSSVMMGVDR